MRGAEEGGAGHGVVTAVVVKLDVRERALIPELKSLAESASASIPIRVEVERLDVGDVQIWLDLEESTPIDARRVAWMVYERKTGDDLLASLNTGRYAEQRERLLAWLREVRWEGVRAPQLLYLLEAIDGVDEEKQPRLRACLDAMIGVHGLHVVRTRSVEESARHVWGVAVALHRRAVVRGTLELGPGAYDDPDADRRERAECAAVASRKRGNAIDQRQCWVRQLCCVPGIGASTARKIAAAIPDMAALIDFVRGGGADDAARRLAARVPGLGPKLAATVVATTVMAAPCHAPADPPARAAG